MQTFVNSDASYVWQKFGVVLGLKSHSTVTAYAGDINKNKITRSHHMPSLVNDTVIDTTITDAVKEICFN